MGSYLLFAVALYAGGMYVENIMGMWLTYAVRIVLLLIYVGVVCTFENVLVALPHFPSPSPAMTPKNRHNQNRQKD